jgi:NACalpha-BTF3-like transcription factor
MSVFTQSDTNEVIEITCSNDVLDISGGTEFKKTDQQLREEKIIKERELQIIQIKEESVKMICRQTELSEEEAKKELEEVNYDYMKVLNKYFGVEEKKSKKMNTTNQQIYGEIRNLMDTGAKNFRLERERNEQIQKMKGQQEEIYRQRVAHHMKKIKEDEIKKKNDSKLDKVEEAEEEKVDI